MKHQKHYSGGRFGPKLRKPLRPKLGNGSVRKKNQRFVSKPMIRIQKQVNKVQANVRYVLAKRRNGKDIGATNKAYGHNSKKCPSTMVINKFHKDKSSEKDQRGKVARGNADAMKKDFPPVAISRKSGHAFSSKKLVKPTLMSSTSKMKEGFVHRANNAEISSLQPKSLKVMPGLVLNSKRPHNLDQGPATWMHKRDRMNGCNDITNDDNLKSANKPIEEKSKSHDDDCSEGETPTHRTMKRQRRYIGTNEDEDNNGDNGHEGLGDDNDSPRLTPQDDILKDCHDRVFAPVVANCLNKQCYCCSKPIDEAVWRGLLKIGNKEYMPLSGHLSTKSCEKVRTLSKSLSRVVEVTKLPRSKVWPKRWEGSSPIDDNIGLYFFSHKMRPDKCHDHLLKEVMENDLALRAIIGDAEMLIFPSSQLPERYQSFQMKHYLWGVFKPKEAEGKQSAAMHQPDHTTGSTAFAAKATSPGITTDAASIPPGPTGNATDAASIPTKDATNAPTIPANHGQIELSSMGAPPGRMLAFVVRQTPRLEQLIQEMQQEGALVMQGELMSTGSWTGNIAAASSPWNAARHEASPQHELSPGSTLPEEASP